MNVNPGSLCKPIKIIQKTKTRGADGYYTETETTVYSGYAKFSRTSGTEMIKASADFADVKARFLIRYTTASIDRKMIVRYDGMTYRDWETDRKSTRLNSSHSAKSRMPSSA